jgi:class 3 adenylate cyclase
MEPAIINNGGFIDKYIGDAIMALFEGSADGAVKAGVTMLNTLADYNVKRQRSNRQPIEIGIGINTGNLMLGTVGGNSRIDTTVIGDAVNLSARLQELTKVYQTPLLISHNTFACLEETMKYALRVIAQEQVRGKAQNVSVFEVFETDPAAQKQAKLETRPIFEAALIYYHTGAMEKAKSLFNQCLQKNPSDRVSQIYLQRCASIF